MGGEGGMRKERRVEGRCLRREAIRNRKRYGGSKGGRQSFTE